MIVLKTGEITVATYYFDRHNNAITFFSHSMSESVTCTLFNLSVNGNKHKNVLGS